jgi:hypothetical protein
VGVAGGVGGGFGLVGGRRLTEDRVTEEGLAEHAVAGRLVAAGTVADLVTGVAARCGAHGDTSVSPWSAVKSWLAGTSSPANRSRTWEDT